MPVVTDQITQAWLIGWFSCLMTVFPVAMILLIPHTGWDRGRRERELLDTIDRISMEKAAVQESLKVHQSALDSIIKYQFETGKGT